MKRSFDIVIIHCLVMQTATNVNIKTAWNVDFHLKFGKVTALTAILDG